ncbi:uncharacterized protein BROUX77_000124 [Berkeleyomyces rouxiae]|uniref:uncharacterized protein n=1 Tax=Berkeleyomyces rouxiae TaxID=2035830 RepID=UPI003B82C0F4
MATPKPTQDWTPVRRGKKNRRAQPTKAQTASASADPTPASPSHPPPASPPTVTLAEIRAAHEMYAAQWAAAPCSVRLAGLLGERDVAAAAAAAARVRRAVCVGVGSFDAEVGWQARRRAHTQVIAFLEIVEALRKKSGMASFRCIFQEPAFTTEDCKFIESLGHEVVASPAGFECIDETTFVFGIHLYAAIYSEMLSHSLPALFVGTGWDAWDDTTKKPQRIAEMHAAYEKAEFPQDDSYTFSSTAIYWKPFQEAKADTLTAANSQAGLEKPPSAECDGESEKAGDASSEAQADKPDQDKDKIEAEKPSIAEDKTPKVAGNPV